MTMVGSRSLPRRPAQPIRSESVPMDYLTKDDLRSVLAEALAPLATREEMRALREEMRTDFADVRQEMRTEFADVRQEMRTEFAAVRDEMRTSPTRDEMHTGFAAVREEMRAFPTRDEMREGFAAVREEMRTFATREEVFATFPTRDQMQQAIRDAGEGTRRHFDMVAESLRDDIRMLAEGVAALHQRVDNVRTELKGDIGALDRRVMRLEVSRR
jgi:hypothetical protein